MQSGNFAVMGFWDRQRVDEIWGDALQELNLSGHDDPLDAMREVHWQQLLDTKALAVSVDETYKRIDTQRADGRVRSVQ